MAHCWPPKDDTNSHRPPALTGSLKRSWRGPCPALLPFRTGRLLCFPVNGEAAYVVAALRRGLASPRRVDRTYEIDPMLSHAPHQQVRVHEALVRQMLFGQRATPGGILTHGP